MIGLSARQSSTTGDRVMSCLLQNSGAKPSPRVRRFIDESAEHEARFKV